MTDHAKRRQAVHSVGDTQDIADAIDRCNLKPEYKRLLKILYVDNGCLEDVCEAVGREYTTSQQAQNQYLVSQLGCKAPVPAFNVPAPWQYGNYGCSDCSNY